MATTVTDTAKYPVKVGVVGCGVVAAAYYLPYLMAHADLVAVCDSDGERAKQSARIFGAEGHYQDYFQMLDRGDIEAVFILTGPGTHTRFAVAAAESGRHLLLQKPMATSLEDADAIVRAVRLSGVKAVIEPSAHTPLDPVFAELRELVQKGALGEVHWFSLVRTGPDRYGPGLGMNPYGAAAFFAAESGGFLFDDAYAPTEVATLLGSCVSVTGCARVSVGSHMIVPDVEFTKFLTAVTNPYEANYWDKVLDLPRTEQVRSEAPDNVICVLEMENGTIGTLRTGRIYHPTLPKTDAGLQIYGSDGNLVLGGGYTASVISNRKDLVPHRDTDGWYHVPVRGDVARAKWPRPVPGGFNYYEESSRHLLHCITEGQEPLVNAEWGRHITEIMVGARRSADTGCRYEMTTRLGS
jgi:predicted dehydrogenase